jgi:hypothetical protein
LNINWVWRHSLEDDNEVKEREGGPCFPSPPLERPRRLEGVFL